MKRIFGIILLVFLLQFVLAQYNVEYYGVGEGMEINENENSVFTISVENTDNSSNSNVTRINIVLNNNFIFLENSHGTDTEANFSYESNTLTWISDSLIGASETKHFWFAVNVINGGNYTIYVQGYNSTGMFESPLGLTVIGEECTPDWNCTEWSNCENETQTRNCSDINECGINTNKPSENQTCNTTKECTPTWSCSNWSECLSSIQTRICNDSNDCNNETGKPAESQTCEETPEEVICQPNWNCSQWFPTECPEEETLKRECTDLNNCGNNSGKPTESKKCEYKSPLIGNLIFTILAILLFCTILFVVFLVIKIKFFKKIE